MRTDDLIRAIAADGKARETAPEPTLCGGLMVAAAVAAGLFFLTLGPRPHFLALLGEPRFAFKLGLVVLLAGASCRLVLRLARPGADPHGTVSLLASVPVLLAIGTLAELLAVPAGQWAERLVGTHARACLIAIPLLSMVPLAATLFGLRHGAPDHPGSAGACGGLLAGAMGAVLYATHCPDDSPLFVATWYPIAIAIVVALGGFCGSRMLRW